MDGEAALGVVDEAEVLAGLLDADHVHETGGVGGVGADFAVDLDEALLKDSVGLARVEGILQAASKFGLVLLPTLCAGCRRTGCG